MKHLYLSLLLTIFSTSSYAQSSMARNMCESIVPPHINSAIQMQSMGMPMSLAMKGTDSLMSLSYDIWFFVNATIKAAYEDPDIIQTALNKGLLIDLCEGHLMGTNRIN